MKILFLIFAFGLEFLCLSREIVDKSVASANSNRPFAVCLYGMFIRQWPLKPLNRLFDLENTDFFVHTSDRLLENEKEDIIPVSRGKICDTLRQLGAENCSATTETYTPQKFHKYRLMFGDEMMPNSERVPSCFYSISRCVEMINHSEHSRTAYYEGIILTRADILDFITFNPSFIKEVRQENMKGLRTAWIGSFRNGHISTRKMEDRFMIGTRHALIFLRKLLDAYPEIAKITMDQLYDLNQHKIHDGRLLVHEWMIFEFLLHHNVTIAPRVASIDSYVPFWKPKRDDNNTQTVRENDSGTV